MIRTGSSLCLAVAMAACGGGIDDPYADADPRCVAACPIRVPDIDGAFEVCSADSARACVDQCEARIAGAVGVCADCLLEEAWFAPEARDVSEDCDVSSCTVRGYGGTCTYPTGDRTAAEDCLRIAFPRREVTCDVDFRPVNDCGSVCG